MNTELLVLRMVVGLTLSGLFPLIVGLVAGLGDLSGRVGTGSEADPASKWSPVEKIAA